MPIKTFSAVITTIPSLRPFSPPLLIRIKSSAIFSKNGVNDINLEIPSGKNKVVVSASSGAQGENRVEVDCESEGNENRVVVNYKYLLDGLGVISGDNVRLEVIDNNTPCVVKAENNEGYIYVVMPIKQ